MYNDKRKDKLCWLVHGVIGSLAAMVHSEFIVETVMKTQGLLGRQPIIKNGQIWF